MTKKVDHIVKTSALTLGIVWGLCLCLMTILSDKTGYGMEFLKSIKSVYPGYTISMMGALVGLVYGFLDGFIGLYIFAWVWQFIDKRVN